MYPPKTSKNKNSKIIQYMSTNKRWGFNTSAASRWRLWLSRASPWRRHGRPWRDNAIRWRPWRKGSQVGPVGHPGCGWKNGGKGLGNAGSSMENSAPWKMVGALPKAKKLSPWRLWSLLGGWETPDFSGVIFVSRKETNGNYRWKRLVGFCGEVFLGWLFVSQPGVIVSLWRFGCRAYAQIK